MTLSCGSIILLKERFLASYKKYVEQQSNQWYTT